jgi:hypothetical protein
MNRNSFFSGDTMQAHYVPSIETFSTQNTKMCKMAKSRFSHMILAFFRNAVQHEILCTLYQGFSSRISDCKLLMKTFDEILISHKPFAGYCDAK